ncbi:MAG TPA: hypothetical protein VMS96_09325 [Terriglobales bacterium]|nr:hypothetical protein [Terriglobales bacterium]
MRKVKGFLSRILTLVLFALSWTRVAVGRILPVFSPSPEPRSAKVFALTEAEWSALRADNSAATQEKSADQQQDKSNGAGRDKDSSKGEDKKDQAKSPDCEKAAPKTGDEQKSTEDKKKDAAKPCEQGPGGGDGDMGGTGG